MAQGAADVARLGTLRSVHEPPPLHRALIGPILIAGLIAAAAAALGAPLAIVVALAAVTLAILAWRPLRIRGCSIALHAQGLVLMKSGNRQVIAFEDVNEVWFEIDALHSQAGAYVRAFRLIDYGGQGHRVPLAVNDGATLASSILRGCSVPLLDDAGRALRQGETLTFGKIQLDRDGITVGRVRTAWHEIRQSVLSHGRVHLYRRLPIIAWRTVRLDRIPNPAVFIGLVAQCVAKTRIEDQLLAPLAAEVQGRRPLTEEERNELALRRMLSGGLVCIAGIAITWATYSANHHEFYLVYGPILFGALRFFQGLATLLSGRRR